jgi:hypothetical protein
MALFTDGLVSSIDDLSAQDSQLLDVSTAENIDVTQKLALAQEEVALGLNALLTGMSYPGQSLWLSPQPGVNRVVVTPALRLWHTYRALEMVYADAYNSQLNDRYAGKRDQFHSMASWAYDKLARIGAGMVIDPVPKAAMPALTALASATPLPDGTYYATMAWANQTGEEGAGAAPNTVSTASQTLLVETVDPPKNAVGWNVYVGVDTDSMFRQNETPIAIAQTWTQPAPLTTTGRRAGQGQTPTILNRFPEYFRGANGTETRQRP